MVEKIEVNEKISLRTRVKYSYSENQLKISGINKTIIGWEISLKNYSWKNYGAEFQSEYWWRKLEQLSEKILGWKIVVVDKWIEKN